MEKTIRFLTNGSWTVGLAHTERANLNLYLLPFTKVNLKWIIDLN